MRPFCGLRQDPALEQNNNTCKWGSRDLAQYRHDSGSPSVTDARYHKSAQGDAFVLAPALPSKAPG